MFRFLSRLYRSVPLPEARKEWIKHAVYSRMGALFVGSPNHATWLRQQASARQVSLAPPPVEPSATQWNAIAAQRSRPRPHAPLVGSPYIVVPVYSGRTETLACLYSVLKADPWSEIVAIDDCSPDASLSAQVETLAADGLFEFLRNETNMGFARTANRGMLVYPDRDVVLLNSDTEVYSDWLARLSRRVHSAPEIGTATPLSNNAEICSYPHWLQDNAMQIELGYEALDRLARRTNAGRFAQAPTAVGFCMYIRRGCLADVGPFDERFSEGYGEENDFCLRASGRGWQHVIAGDIFVRHIGAVSFGRKNLRRRRKALKLIHEQYPDYDSEIQAYIARDPLREIRVRLDTARLIEACAGRESQTKPLLVAVHDWGGGVDQHVGDMQTALASEGVETYQLRPTQRESASGMVTLSGPHGVVDTPSLQQLRLDGDQSELLCVLRKLRIGHIHIHHVGGFHETASGDLRRLAVSLGCQYDVTLHDFAAFCPRLHLTDESGYYCREPDSDACERCVSNLGSPFGVVSVVDWRDRWRTTLNGARRVFCPSHDTETRVKRRFPDASYVVRPHQERPQPSVAPAPQRQPGGVLRVAVPGAIGEQKGFDLLVACARDSRSRRLPIEFQVVGYTMNHQRTRRAGIEVSGVFLPQDGDAALSDSNCHIAFLPSLTPETFSFALSAAFRVRMFPVVFDLGALAERIRAVRWGEVLPCSMMTDARRVNDHLLALEIPLAPATIDTAWSSKRYPSVVKDYYENFAL